MLTGDEPRRDDQSGVRAGLASTRDSQIDTALLSRLMASVDSADALDSESSLLNFVDDQRRSGWPLADVLAGLEEDVARELGVAVSGRSFLLHRDGTLERLMNRLVPLVVCRYSNWARHLR